MTDYAKSLKDKLDIVTLSREDFNTICKDRLDFGFDSIYFRYSEAIEELSWFKKAEARRNGNMNFNRKNWCDTRRQHFYMCLEQLTHAHDQEEGK